MEAEMRRIGVGGAVLLMLLVAGLASVAGASAAEYEPDALPELGFIRNIVKSGKLVVEAGLDFKPPPPLSSSLFEFECGGSLQVTRIEGSLIGKISPIDVMTTKSNLLLQVVKGKQQYKKFQGE